MRRFVAAWSMCVLAAVAGCGNVPSTGPDADVGPLPGGPDAASPGDPDGGVPDPADASMPDAATGDFYIVTAAATFVRINGAGTLTVSIVRGEGFVDAVSLAVQGLPAGVTVAPATIAADATSTTLRFASSASGGASAGTEAAISITATSAAAGRDRSVASRLTVAGMPGTLDTSFGDGGILVDGLSSAVGDKAESAFAQSDGRVVTVGNSTVTNGARIGITLRRYTRTGEIDDTFGTSGTLSETFSDLGGLGYAGGHAIPQASGAIIVVGSADVDPAPDVIREHLFIRRYTMDGKADRSFLGHRIVVPTGVGGFTRAAVGPNDEILLSGRFTVSASRYTSYVLRLSRDGVVDSAFGSEGIAVLDSDYAFTDPRGLEVLDDGSVVIALAGSNPSTITAGYWAVRLSRTGTADRAFAGDGSLEVTSTEVNGIRRLGDGSFLLFGGTSILGDAADPFVLKFDAIGQPIQSFGANGVWTDTGHTNHQATAIGIDEAKGIVVAGLRMRDIVTPIGLVVSSIKPSGVPDPSFGSNGKMTTDIRVSPGFLVTHDAESRVTVVGGTVSSSGITVDQVLIRLWK